jgi:PEP-CTERM motif
MKKDHLPYRARNLAVAAVASLAFQLAPSPGWADTINVFVGYADNLRPSGFFPSPWLTDGGVVSQSPAAQTFDSGAIRIDNTGASSVTITNLQVFFPSNGSTFAIWNPLVIGAGQTGIFAQNNGVDTQFDTSDFGVFGGLPPSNLDPSPGNLIGGCSSPTAIMTASQVTQCNSTIPVISFLENGNPMSFQDTGHILDTGEWDFVNNNNGSLPFQQDGNESINWNLVGSTPNRGGTAAEPGTLALFGLSLAALGFVRRKLNR